MRAFPRMRCECAHMRAFRASDANARTCAHFPACDAMRCDARMRCDANARIKGELMRVRYCTINYNILQGFATDVVWFATDAVCGASLCVIIFGKFSFKQYLFCKFDIRENVISLLSILLIYRYVQISPNI